MQNIDKSILRIALPSIVANITVPLLGLVDMAVSGHLGNAVYIGAVAVGSMIFNVIYWVFGFLRMGTSGMTSQALGRRDMGDVATTLARSIAVAIGVAAFILLLQRPLGTATLALVGATEEINAEAWHYFRICVWGAPAMLCLYSLTGWYIGMQNTRLPMFISIMQNVVNIAASCTFVYAVGGTGFLALLTDEPNVVAAAADYAPWAVLIPVCGLAAFIWDGVFIGTTNTRGMFAATAVAMLVFFAVYLSLRGVWHNHALWLAFLTYLAARGAVQSAIYLRIKANSKFKN